MSRPADAAGRHRVAAALGGILSLLLIAGALVALVVGPAWLLLVFLLVYAGGLLVVHLAVGIGSYRSVMRREWPEVEPLDDEDDDW